MVIKIIAAAPTNFDCRDDVIGNSIFILETLGVANSFDVVRMKNAVPANSEITRRRHRHIMMYVSNNIEHPSKKWA